MPNYRVQGFNTHTNQRVDCFVEAPNEHELRERARLSGILIEYAVAQHGATRDITPVVARPVATPPAAPAPPQLFWFGEMRCFNCGYQWKARRSTPPAKCAGCGRRNIQPIMRPKPAIGCAVILFAWASAVSVTSAAGAFVLHHILG